MFKEVLKTFSNTTDRTDQKLFQRFSPVTNITAALDRIATEADFAVLESGKFLRYAAKVTYFNGFSSALHVTKECPMTYNVGFVMPIGSPYYERVNTVSSQPCGKFLLGTVNPSFLTILFLQLLRRFQNAGLIDKWLGDIMYEAVIKNPNLKTKVSKSYGLTLNHLKLCFVLVLFGHFFGGVSCFTEKMIDSYKKQKAIKVKLWKERKASRISQLSIKSATPSVLVGDPSDD